MSTHTDVSLSPHALPAAEVLRLLETDADGLTSDDATVRLLSTGRNALPDPPRPPAWRRFVGHFDDVLVYILLTAAVLKAILGNWVDFTVILAVAVINALVGFLQEGRAQKALDSIKQMLSLEAQVRRDGQWGLVDAATLVPGDVVRVRAGDRVPADLRLLTATNLQVDEAALTGESVPAAKGVAPVADDAGVGDRTCLLFSSTLVTTGVGEGVVTATGAATEIGKIQTLVAEVDPLDTPLTRQLARLGKHLSILIAAMAAVMLIIGRVIHDFPRDELISAAIGFAVAAVPEGLPALVTITLALGVQQMARRRAITRRLTAVEALGAVTTICSDKTGTLTQNEMTVRVVITPLRTYTVTGSGYSPSGHLLDPGGEVATAAEHQDLDALVLAVGCANDARLEQVDGRWRVVGQPTEGALDVLAVKAQAATDAVTRVAQVPFESAHKLSATLDDVPGTGRVIHVIGAPDRLLERCTAQWSGIGTARLDTAVWEATNDELGAQGLRVLAAASFPATARPAAADPDALTLADLDTGLVFLGLVGIVDPPRPEATAAVADCHAAGIGVKMITGDHAGTAVAIARELGIVGDGAVVALTGAELEAMSQSELRQRVREVDVFARTSPEHKIRIVRALQSHGEVVAMTGDGVNDAPALTRADIGVAMGIKGTEATKDAADIVLADDNFATIERAVEEGRRIYDNIRKSVVFLLPTNGAQSLVILVAVLFGLTLPLDPVQILWVNLVTAVTLSLALAAEPAEPSIMRRPPRDPSEPLLSRPSLVLVLLVSVIIGAATLLVFALERNAGVDLARAQTVAVGMLAAGQGAYLLSCRFLATSSLHPRVLRGNRLVWAAFGALLLLQLVFTYAPFMHTWFHSAPIYPRDWALLVGLSAVVFLLTEAAKTVSRHVPSPTHQTRA
ncbi:MAG: HAD-IC family P-type ATPase [Micrococcales bacterium]|nr:HAD-IC family P-type ATPase [Micrococcales bacterium]